MSAAVCFLSNKDAGSVKVTFYLCLVTHLLDQI